MIPPTGVWVRASYPGTYIGLIGTAGNQIEIRNADSVVLQFTAATDYRGGDPGDACAKRLAAAGRKKFSRLLSEHAADFGRLFGRVSLDLGRRSFSKEDPATDERIRAAQDYARAHGDFPVIVAGGIYTHEDIVRFLALGADGEHEAPRP